MIARLQKRTQNCYHQLGGKEIVQNINKIKNRGFQNKHEINTQNYLMKKKT